MPYLLITRGEYTCSKCLKLGVSVVRYWISTCTVPLLPNPFPFFSLQTQDNASPCQNRAKSLYDASVILVAMRLPQAHEEESDVFERPLPGLSVSRP